MEEKQEKSRIDRQFDFIREIDKEKFITRQTFLSDAKRRENDAEHAWHMAIMTLLLSEYANEEIDVLRVISMLLIHDLVEIDAGDTYAYDEEGFNIYGGSNQILPNATSATQNYYGDEAELEKDDVSKDKEPALSPEATRLFSYINKVEDLRIYLVQIAECTNAVELARVIVKMGEREPKITSEEMVKERFISLFFPLTPLFVSGKTVSNIRARINNAWARRPRKRL